MKTIHLPTSFSGLCYNAALCQLPLYFTAYFQHISVSLQSYFIFTVKK